LSCPATCDSDSLKYCIDSLATEILLCVVAKAVECQTELIGCVGVRTTVTVTVFCQMISTAVETSCKGKVYWEVDAQSLLHSNLQLPKLH